MARRPAAWPFRIDILGQGMRSARSGDLIGRAGPVASLLLLTKVLVAAQVEGQAPPSFETHIRPILASNCQACHGAGVQQAGLDLRTVAGVLRGGDSGPAVKPGLSGESELFLRVRSGSMPLGDGKLSAAEVELIRRWIDGGTGSSGSLSGDGDHVAAEGAGRDVFATVLQVRCVLCHGRRNQEGGLDLRTRASLLKGGRSGPAVVPGKPEESLLLERIANQEMPPPESLRDYAVRPVTSGELEELRAWIRAGAPAGTGENRTAESAPATGESGSGQGFWSFSPPRRPSVPVVRHGESVRTPIDAFLLERLESGQLAFSPEADRLTLVRRAYFDLVGLPPSPEEIEDYLDDRSPRAYERMVDRLLDSVRYGERWARYWLDAAGYSDSEGKIENDLVRPHFYRYRDYVIRSLNADKPYDQFLMEQIAGDEMFDYKAVGEPTQDQVDKLVATGFLRTAPDGSYSLAGNTIADRLNVVADQVEILSSSVMGLTVGCARCHSHKYDPISLTDYYRFSAIFRTAYDPYDWLFPNRNIDDPDGRTVFPLRHLSVLPSKEYEEVLAHNRPIHREISALEASLEEMAEKLRGRLLEERLAGLPETVRDDLQQALQWSDEGFGEEERYRREKCFRCGEQVLQGEATKGGPTEVQAYLLDKFRDVVRIEEHDLEERFDDFRTESERIGKAVKAAREQLIPGPRIRALFDMGGDPTPVHLLRRADHLSPGSPVQPGVPSALGDGLDSYRLVKPPWTSGTSGRRLALARWLVQPNHPLTARVIVNRVWQHHFGTGLVTTPGDFGHTGSRPSHPELLDWLATEFVHGGWSLKDLHRLIMRSTAYRQSSQFVASRHAADPDNVLLSRFSMRRLDADAIRDAVLKVAGRLDLTPFGPAAGAEVRSDGEVVSECTQAGCRRSIYTLQRRTRPDTLLETFDAPQMTPNCLRRDSTTVSSQALQLWNSDSVRESARHFAGRVIDAVGPDLGEQVERVYLAAYSRRPSGIERESRVQQLRDLTRHWIQQLKQQVPAEPIHDRARWLALANLCHAVVNSAEFIYVD